MPILINFQAMEIDSLNNMSRQHHENHSSENDNNFMTRLPSFSSIIGNNSIATTTCSSEHLHSTSVSDLGLHVSHMLHEQQHEAEIHSRGSSMVGIHSRRSSIDNEGLIIHESHPGSRRESPVTSRRPSVDHDSIMHHLSDRRSSVDQVPIYHFSGSQLEEKYTNYLSHCATSGIGSCNL